MARPPTYDDAVRRRLLDETAAALAAGGPHGVALREVCARAGTTTNAVYALFGGKEALLDAVLEEARAGFVAAQRAVPRTDDPLADAANLGFAYRDWALTHPLLYAVLMPGQPGRTDATTSWFGDDGTAEPLLDVCRRAVAAGAFRDADPEEIAVHLWAAVHGLVSLELVRWQRLPRQDRDRLMTSALQAMCLPWLPS